MSLTLAFTASKASLAHRLTVVGGTRSTTAAPSFAAKMPRAAGGLARPTVARAPMVSGVNVVRSTVVTALKPMVPTLTTALIASGIVGIGVRGSEAVASR